MQYLIDEDKKLKTKKKDLWELEKFCFFKSF
jgi:hypothetical protein